MIIYLRHLRRPALAVLALLFLLGAGWSAYDIWDSYTNYVYGEKSEEMASEAFLTAIGCFGREGGTVEIFDIEKGEVVKRLDMNSELRVKAVNILDKISGMYVKVKAFPEKGKIARLPLDPAVEVQNKWLKDYGISSVSEVFIIFPEGNRPYLLVLDSNYRPLFFNFEYEVKEEFLDV